VSDVGADVFAEWRVVPEDVVPISFKVIPWYCIAHPYCARFSRH